MCNSNDTTQASKQTVIGCLVIAIMHWPATAAASAFSTSGLITAGFDTQSVHGVVVYAAADVQVDPETYVVTVDGVALKCEAAKTLPLSRLYFLF
jgi:hypothetical protein